MKRKHSRTLFHFTTPKNVPAIAYDGLQPGTWLAERSILWWLRNHIAAHKNIMPQNLVLFAVDTHGLKLTYFGGTRPGRFTCKSRIDQNRLTRVTVYKSRNEAKENPMNLRFMLAPLPPRLWPLCQVCGYPLTPYQDEDEPYEDTWNCDACTTVIVNTHIKPLES